MGELYDLWASLSGPSENVSTFSLLGDWGAEFPLEGPPGHRDSHIDLVKITSKPLLGVNFESYG